MMNNLGNYFALFSLPLTFQQDELEIKSSFLKLQREIHPDNFVDATVQEKRLSIEYAAFVNQAYQTLSDPLKRAIYLLSLRGIDVKSETDLEMPLDFLTEQIDLREKLAAGDYLLVKQSVNQALSEIERDLILLLDPHPIKGEEARLKVRQWQFYVRLHEESEAVENENSTNATASY